MTIQTKYNTGDLVWVMLNNKPTNLKINKLYIERSIFDGFSKISYSFVNEPANFQVQEELVFNRKQDLREYLFQQ